MDRSNWSYSNWHQLHCSILFLLPQQPKGQTPQCNSIFLILAHPCKKLLWQQGGKSPENDGSTCDVYYPLFHLPCCDNDLVHHLGPLHPPSPLVRPPLLLPWQTGTSRRHHISDISFGSNLNCFRLEVEASSQDLCYEGRQNGIILGSWFKTACPQHHSQNPTNWLSFHRLLVLF